MSSGIALALTAVQAVQSIGQGYAERAESKYNASILEGQAGMIDIQKGIDNNKYERLKSRTMSTSMANIAGMGIRPTGSPMAVLLDTQKQISLDQAYNQFNYDREKQAIMSKKESVLRKGKQAVTAGYSNAFSKVLSGVSNYAMYSGMFQSQDMGGGGISKFGNKYGSNTPKGTFDMGTYSRIRR